MNRGRNATLEQIITMAACYFLLWGCSPSKQGTARLEVFRNDPSAEVMKVVVDVVNDTKRPVANVEVSIRNNAGESLGKTTSEGRAVISVGEPLIKGLVLAGTNNISLGWRKLDARERVRLVITV
jgi:hypothetical protein